MDKVILLFGASGQVGREVLRAAGRRNLPVVGLGRSDANIVDAAQVGQAVARWQPRAIINAAAYTAVDAAEANIERAFAVNHVGAANVAAAAERHGAVLLHLSTDYVFRGDKASAYGEEDPQEPVSVYGSSKAAGEAAVRERGPRHVILRTAWVFSAHGTNFVKTILRLVCEERRNLRIVNDQNGCPTPARDIAEACLAVVAQADAPSAWGTYNFAGSPPVTWHGFARAIIAEIRRHSVISCELQPILTAEYPTAAQRPANSILDCAKIRQHLGIEAPDWRRGLSEVIAELTSQRLGVTAAMP